MTPSCYCCLNVMLVELKPLILDEHAFNFNFLGLQKLVRLYLG